VEGPAITRARKNTEVLGTPEYTKVDEARDASEPRHGICFGTDWC